MGINIRAKGQNGEREIANDLNEIICSIHKRIGIPIPEKPLVQRNQNQSAVGGCDLSGTFGLAIEVKRQEQLAINTWWDQCEKSANELGQTPVLLFRQNGKKWRCILYTELALGQAGTLGPASIRVRSEIEYADFCKYFEIHVLRFYGSGAAKKSETPEIGHQTLF